MSNVTSLDDYRDIEEIVKNRFDAESVVIGAVNKAGDTITYFSPQIRDVDFVYIVQTLQDRRTELKLGDS